MSFEVTGQNSLADMVKKLKNLKEPLKRGLQKSAESWRAEIQQGMLATPRNAAGHSEPGAFPAVQTGMLLTSFAYEIRGWNEIEVGTPTPYAVYLEAGTSKMLPRPMIETQFDLLHLRERFQSYIQMEIQRYIGR